MSMEREGKHMPGQPIGLLPSNLIAQHQYDHKDFKLCSDAELAQFDFEPLEFHNQLEPPSNHQWLEATPDALMAMRLAWINTKFSKDGLVDICAKMDAEHYDDLIDKFRLWTNRFRMHASLMEMASDRMIVALAALVERGDVEAVDTTA